MRIAIFTESYEPIVNGVSVSVATLRDALRMRGHEVYIFAPRFRGHEDTETVYRFPSRMSRFAPGYPIPVFREPAKLWAAFNALKPDIAHTQTPFILGLAGLRWARATGIPAVSTNHTLYTEYVHYLPFVPKSVTKAFLVRWMRWYYNRCDAVVVPCQPVQQVLRDYGVRTRIEIIKSGVAAIRTDARQEVRRTFDIPKDAFLLLYVGRLAREKNLGLLLRAFKTVRERFPHSRLMIVGSGPYEHDSLTQARELGIGDCVKFAGMLDRSVVARIYSAADAFVFPSVTETQGLVLCEALSAGLPCVAVRAAGTPEVVQDGVDGILTENSVEDFGASICRLIADPDLRERLSQGGLRSAAKFSTDAMAQRFEAFYQSVIETAARREQGAESSVCRKVGG